MSRQLLWLAAILIVDAGLTALSARGQSTVRWNVVEMGAVADGATDSTAAFQTERPEAASSKRPPDDTVSTTARFPFRKG